MLGRDLPKWRLPYDPRHPTYGPGIDYVWVFEKIAGVIYDPDTDEEWIEWVKLFVAIFWEGLDASVDCAQEIYNEIFECRGRPEGDVPDVEDIRVWMSGFYNLIQDCMKDSGYDLTQPPKKVYGDGGKLVQLIEDFLRRHPNQRNTP